MTNAQMVDAMKGATRPLSGMNRQMNLPQLQKIAMEFERENDLMEQRQEMMDDAVDDAMDVGVEEEGDEVVEQVLEEIGVDFNQSVSLPPGTPQPWPGSESHGLTTCCSLEKHQRRSATRRKPRAALLRLLEETAAAAAAAVRATP